MSVPLNIAEAVEKASEADRNNRYAIARGEAMECGAIIEVIRLAPYRVRTSRRPSSF
jgi:four helix bundle protein